MRVTVDGHTLSQRVWDLIADARKAAGLAPGAAQVMQGSWSRGVSASAGTHAGGGVFDLSIRGLSKAQQLALVNELRRRNVCAWLRTPAYGWPSRLGGPHIHGVVRDEPMLSASALVQVHDYDLSRNGLANKKPDPFPRPKQYPMEEVRLMEFPVGKSILVNPKPQTTVAGGKWVSLTTIDIPAGGRYLCTLQVEMPAGVPDGEARLARMGWGAQARPGVPDTTGHNPIPAATIVQRWRTPIHHEMTGGGPLEFQVYLPPGTHSIDFVAKATRFV